jgi:hypothetical protein
VYCYHEWRKNRYRSIYRCSINIAPDAGTAQKLELGSSELKELPCQELSVENLNHYGVIPVTMVIPYLWDDYDIAAG